METPTIPYQLLSLIRNGENHEVEFKEAFEELPKNLFDTVCSFSNREGGDIFLGVHDSGVILGVNPSKAAKFITDFGTQANNEDKISPPTYLIAKEYKYISDGSFVGITKNGKNLAEKKGEYHILHIHVPEAHTVVRHHGRIIDRNGDADIDITNMPDIVFQCYSRKQNTYYVNKVYPHWDVSNLRADLIERARQMAISNKQFLEKQRHPWADMTDEQLLRSAGLILEDDQGRKGITLAAVLLFGADNMIFSACSQHRTDCIYRVYNVDRYDDRDIIETNLLDSYDRMIEFGQKHLNDQFVLDGIQRVSARNAILREIVSNSLAHRDYSSGYIPKMVIERDRILVENGNRAHGIGALNINAFKPYPKNPAISKVFREIGLADELGSGMRNSYKYTKLYSGADPQFIEGDVFEIIIPLTTGSMTKVGPGTSTVASGQVESASEQVKCASVQVEELIEFCIQPRTRSEIQEKAGISSREYFRKNILVPLLQSGRLVMTNPEKPNSSKQKYVKAGTETVY